MQQEDVDDLLLGMSSQIAEQEDSIVVEDLQGRHSEHIQPHAGHTDYSLGAFITRAWCRSPCSAWPVAETRPARHPGLLSLPC